MPEGPGLLAEQGCWLERARSAPRAPRPAHGRGLSANLGGSPQTASMAEASEQFMKLLEDQRSAFISGFVELARAQCHEWALATASRLRLELSSGAAEAAVSGGGGAGSAGVEASGADKREGPDPAQGGRQHHRDKDGRWHRVRSSSRRRSGSEAAKGAGGRRGGGWTALRAHSSWQECGGPRRPDEHPC